MNTLSAIIMFISLIALGVGVLLFIIRINFKKEKLKGKPRLIILISIVGFILGIIGVATIPRNTTELKWDAEAKAQQKEKEKKIELQEKEAKEDAAKKDEKDKLAKEKKAEEEKLAQAKKEQEQKEKEAKEMKEKEVAKKKEAKEKAEKEANAKKLAEDKKKTDKANYEKYTKPTIDNLLNEYDMIWSNLWSPAFTGLSNGSMSQYDAYQNIKSVEIRYENMYSAFNDIPTNKLSSADKKAVKSFISKMQDAAIRRQMAAGKAKKMIDKLDFTPSTMDKITSDINLADSYMLEALAEIVILENNYGIKR